MLCQTGENSAFTRSQMIGFLPAGAIGVGDRIGDKRSCANTFGRLHKELESGNASAGTRFVTMPNPGICRIECFAKLRKAFKTAADPIRNAVPMRHSPVCFQRLFRKLSNSLSGAKHLRMDGKHEHSAAPNSLVLGNLWIIAGHFRSFGDGRPNCTEMDTLICC